MSEERKIEGVNYDDAGEPVFDFPLEPDNDGLGYYPDDELQAEERENEGNNGYHAATFIIIMLGLVSAIVGTLVVKSFLYFAVELLNAIVWGCIFGGIANNRQNLNKNINKTNDLKKIIEELKSDIEELKQR